MSIRSLNVRQTVNKSVYMFKETQVSSKDYFLTQALSNSMDESHQGFNLRLRSVQIKIRYQLTCKSKQNKNIFHFLQSVKMASQYQEKPHTENTPCPQNQRVKKVHYQKHLKVNKTQIYPFLLIAKKSSLYRNRYLKWRNLKDNLSRKTMIQVIFGDSK